MLRHLRATSSAPSMRKPATLGRTTTLYSYVREGWTTTTPTTPLIKPTGLVLSILDVSCSMSVVKSCLATSISACIKTMKVVAPGLDYAVITYTDFDQHSTTGGKPVIEAPDTENWTGDDFVGYFGDTEVRGGGGSGCEGLNSALYYALHDLVPAYKTRHGLTTDFPVLIFVLTDEDVRLCDHNGRYGRVCQPRRGFEPYACTPDSHRECHEEIKLFKHRWDVEAPATASQLRELLVENNCWMRIVKYKGGKGNGGIEELCTVDEAYGYDNDRWQLFHSQESSSSCHYSNITRFMITQQERFFKSVHHSLSSTAVLEEMSCSDMADYVASGTLRTSLDVNEAQVRDFKARFMCPKDFCMARCTSPGHSSHDRLLLTSAYDRASSSTISTIETSYEYEQLQHEVTPTYNDAYRLVGGGNVATCLVAHLKTDSKTSMVMDGIPQDERCDCKGCVKLYNAAKEDPAKQDRYVKVQWARMFANMLIKPMTTDKAMIYACEAIPHEIGSIYEFVCKGSSGVCIEVGKILSEFERSENGKTDAYKLLMAGRSGKDIHYDASFVIETLIKACSKKKDKSVGDEDADDDDDDKTLASDTIGKNLVWLYIPSAEILYEEINSNLRDGNISRQEFKRFEKQQCFDALKKVAKSVKVTRDANEIPAKSRVAGGGKSVIRLRALPVIVNEDDDKEATVTSWAEELFDGRSDVAALAYVPPCHAIQSFINLVDIGLGLSAKGFSGIKAVAAVASLANREGIPSQLSALFNSLSMQALKDYVGGREAFTAEELFDRCLEGVAKGELENNLSNRTTLSCFSQWMKNCDGVSLEKAYRLDHHLFLTALMNMRRNGISKNYQRFAVRELTFDGKHVAFVCRSCKMKTLLDETFPGSKKECVRCGVGDSLAILDFIKEKMGEDFATQHGARHRVAPTPSLNFANWKLSAAEKMKEEFTTDERKLMLSNDRTLKTEAARATIKRLEEGEEVTAAVAAEAVKYTNPVLGGSLLHRMITSGFVEIPAAVCVECSKCGIVYKTTPMTPAKKQERRCPWCKITCKLIRCGEGGLELLTAIKFKSFDGKMTPAETLWLLEILVPVGGSDRAGELTTKNIEEIKSYIEEIKRDKKTQGEANGRGNASPDIFSDAVELSTKINVIGYGPVQVGCEHYTGGETYQLYDHLKWDDFNQCVVLPITGYVLSHEYSSWEDFLQRGNKDEVWKFVGSMSGSLNALSNVESTAIADIDGCVRKLANNVKRV